MVIRTRLRAIVFPLVLYAVSGGAGSYFVWHAVNGERGLKAKVAYKEKMRELDGDLKVLQAEHARWDRRFAMMQASNVDRDLLEEETRIELGRVHKNDLVVFLPSAMTKGVN